MTTDFFWRFLLSRNYKIQIVAHVERKSAVVLSGIMGASYSRFFIGIDFDGSRGRFYCLSTSFKNYHPEASKHLGGRRIELSSTRATLLMKPFLWRTNLKKKTVVVLRSSHVRIL